MKRKNVLTIQGSVLIAALFVFAVLFVALLHEAKAQYQPPDSCLAMTWKHNPDNGEYNPDSVLTDTCKNSPTYDRYYAKYTYIIQIKNGEYIFKQKPVPRDTFITIDEIDTNYNLTKQGFQDLVAKYGSLKFLRAWPQESDSLHLLNPVFWIYFDNYVCIDSARFYLRLIENINGASYQVRFGKEADDVKEESENSISDTTIIIDYFPFNFSIKNTFLKNLSIYNINGNLMDNYVEIIDNNSIMIKYLNNGIYFILINNKFIIKLIVW